MRAFDDKIDLSNLSKKKGKKIFNLESEWETKDP